MTSLARLLRELGHDVTGSDQGIYPPMSTELERMGIPVRTPYQESNLDPTAEGRTPDLVVIGNAIARGNPELEACLDLGLRFTSQAEAIEDLVLPGRLAIVVAGTHGKTTTTSLIAHILRADGQEPGWFIGGVPNDLDASSALGKGRPFVIEGDEYDTAYFDKRPKFHHYRPGVLVIGNLEYDHADIYPSLEAIELEFRRLVNTVPRSGVVIVGMDSPAAARVSATAHCPRIAYGLAEDHDLSASEIDVTGDAAHFTVSERGQHLGRFTLGISGRHNVWNALAAIAVARHLGVDGQVLQRSLADFRGVRRRLELRGTPRGIEVYDDFAHHPTAIRETLEALRARRKHGRLWAILEPRSWSMRRNLHQDSLPLALATADVIVMTPVYQIERVPDGMALDVEAVLADARAAGRQCYLAADPQQIADLVAAKAEVGDAVVVMSNGDSESIHSLLLTQLSATHGTR